MNTVLSENRSYGFRVPANTAESGSFIRDAAIILVLFSVNKLGLPGNIVFFGALAFMINRSIEDSVKAASLLFLVAVGNTSLVSTGNIAFAAGKQLFLIILCWRVLLEASRGRKPRRAFAVLASLMAFSVVAFLLSVQGWYLAHISALKILAFTAGITFVILAPEVLRNRPHNLDRWFVAMAAVIVVLAIGSYFIGIGFNARTEFRFSDRLFNGPFFHSQTFGPACAMIGLYLLCYILFHKPRYRALCLSLLPFLAVFLYMSSARTALLAGGMTVVAACGVFLLQNESVMSQLAKFIRVAILGVLIAGVGVVAIETIAPDTAINFILDFVSKGRDAATVGIEELTVSRAPLVERLLVDISENPITGIGFGVDNKGLFQQNATLFSAPMEKGILPLAVVQENGFVGAGFFLLFLLIFLAFLVRGGYVSGILLMSAFLGINFAEMTFFSFGGAGGIYWTWVLASLCLTQPKGKRLGNFAQPVPVNELARGRVVI